jgi:putative acetyltransferase
MSSPPAIRDERADDAAAVRALLLDAFDREPEVAAVVDDLRASTAWRAGLSFVAEVGGDVVGYVLATRGWVDAPGRLREVLVLSPLAVRPGHQRAGIGGALVRHLLDAAGRRTEPAIFLEGSPDYYARFGFEPATPAGFGRPSVRIPEPAFQLVRLPAFTADLSGALVYPDPFWEHDCVGLRNS